MGKVRVNNMEFYSYHGHFAEEQVVGNHFRVNVCVEFDCGPAGESDALEDALDYQKLYAIVKEEMSIPSKLLEHVANRILHHFGSSFEDIISASVHIEKMNPPLGGKIGSVSVEMEKAYK